MFAPLALAAQLAAHDPSVPFEKYQLPNGLTVILSEDHRLPAGRGRHLVPRRRRQPGARQERLRPSLRAHDVLGREAHRPVPLQDPRRRRHVRRRDGQRYDELRPHQLLRGRPLGRAPDSALARERPHGVPARHARREEARGAARRRLERAAAVVREPPLRHRRAARMRPLLPEAAPLLRLRHRHDLRDPERVDGRPSLASSASSTHPTTLRSRSWATSTRRRPRRWSRSTSAPFPRQADVPRPDIAQPQLPGIVKETIQDQVAKIPRLDLGWVERQAVRSRRGRRRRARAHPRRRQGVAAATRSSCRGGRSRPTSTRTTTRRRWAAIFGIQVTVKQGHTTAELAPVIEQILDDVRKNGVTRRRGRACEARHPRRASCADVERIGGFGGKADLLNRYQTFRGDPGYLSKDLARYRAVTRRCGEGFREQVSC